MMNSSIVRKSIVYISVVILVCVALSGKDKAEFSMVTAVPDISEVVDLAGEKIDLSRFDMYERYERELTAFCYLQSSTLLTIKRANRYFPVIDPILKQYNVPADFKYLAAIESYLNPRAISGAKAAGLWQLMPETAKEYGLEVNEFVDERYDVEKSTHAACKYLLKAYNKYGDWATVAASYNGGMGRISRELDKQITDKAFDLWLNEETSRYVFRIMALKEVMSNPYKYGYVIKQKQLYRPIRTNDVQVTESIDDLARFAKENNITFSQLKEFNSWLRDRSLPVANGKTYTIQLPLEEDMYYNGKTFPVYQKRWVID